MNGVWMEQVQSDLQEDLFCDEIVPSLLPFTFSSPRPYHPPFPYTPCLRSVQDAFDVLESFDEHIDYGILDDPSRNITPEVGRVTSHPV